MGYFSVNVPPQEIAIIAELLTYRYQGYVLFKEK
jgi:hypothetical protein